VPQGPGGRPLAFVAVNGHGAYPVAGTIPRIFYAVRLRSAAAARLPTKCALSSCLQGGGAFTGHQLPSHAPFNLLRRLSP